jgi:hypothetical protein
MITGEQAALDYSYGAITFEQLWDVLQFLKSKGEINAKR